MRFNFAEKFKEIKGMRKFFFLSIFAGIIFEPGAFFTPEAETIPALFYRGAQKQTLAKAKIPAKIIQPKKAKPTLVKMKELMVQATAYSPPLFPQGQMTAFGIGVDWGMVAVDPKKIPLGSIVYFPGFFQGKTFLAVDTGKDIEMDIYMLSEEDAKRFGRRILQAIVFYPSS